MGKRGPQPGWKQRKASEREAAALAAAATAGAEPPVHAPDAQPAASTPLTGDQRNNPRYLSGQVLRDFAHSRGVPRSSLEGKSDAHIREQCRYIVARSLES